MAYDLNVNFNVADTDTSVIENLNFVNPGAFRMVIDSLKYPNAQYTVQAAAIPSISVDGAVQPTPQRNIYATPDKVAYEDLTLTFLIDEKMHNYLEIHDWILGLVTENDGKNVKKTRDLTLIVLDSNNNEVRSIRFADAFPTSLASLPFDVTITDVDYLVASVTFQYSYFQFE